MNQSNEDLRLSRISTLWTVVCQATDPEVAVQAAQRRLLERYGGAVRRYLLAATRDGEAAEELFQEFAVRFLRGGLRGACPERGRFRDYLKGVLIHLVADHHQRKKKLVQMPINLPEPAAESLAEQEASCFLAAGATNCWPVPGRRSKRRNAIAGNRFTPSCVSVPTIPTPPRRKWRSGLSGGQRWANRWTAAEKEYGKLLHRARDCSPWPDFFAR